MLSLSSNCTSSPSSDGWVDSMTAEFCLTLRKCCSPGVCGQDDFYFRVSPEEQSVRSGDTVRLRCQVSSEDGVVVTWSSRRTLPVETSGALPAASTAEEQPVRNSTRVYQSQSDLIIGRVDAKLDSGIAYICTATNVSSGFSIATLPVTIHVLCKSTRSISNGTWFPFFNGASCT